MDAMDHVFYFLLRHACADTKLRDLLAVGFSSAVQVPGIRPERARSRSARASFPGRGSG